MNDVSASRFPFCAGNIPGGIGHQGSPWGTPGEPAKGTPKNTGGVCPGYFLRIGLDLLGDRLKMSLGGAVVHRPKIMTWGGVQLPHTVHPLQTKLFHEGI